MREMKEPSAVTRSTEKAPPDFSVLLEVARTVAIIATDLSDRITYFSPGAEESFGYRAEEVLNRRGADFYRGGSEEADTVGRQLLAQGRIRYYETALRAKDGGWREVSVSFSLVRDPSGAIIGTLGVIREIVDPKREEDWFSQAQKLETLGRLTCGVAHDFNNVLTVMLGISQLLLEAVRHDGPVRQNAEIIRKTAATATELTQRLLAFSRREVLQPKVLDLNTVLGDIAPMLRRLLSEDIELVINPGSELGRVKADPAQLEQVIMNLAVNARDAMPHGGRLTFTTANTEVDAAAARRQDAVRPGRYVMLAVSDTGCGIDAETQVRLFEPFFTTKAAGKGTGLGLAAVHEMVRQSDGHVTVDSEPGSGATFAICLPRVEEAREQAQERRLPTRLMQGSETILLAEDEAHLRNLVRQALQNQGYTVLVARDGKEALRLAERYAGPIHLLLTDVVMPGMSGHELADRLAPVRPEIKVVYMSGHTEDAILRHGVSGHRTAFLQKPFTLDTLARKLREVVDGARADVADPWLQR